MKPHQTGRVLYSAEQIEARIPQLVEEIEARLKGREFVMIGVLRGSFMFMADLLRAVYHAGLHPQIDFISLSSYGAGTVSSGTVQLTRDTDLELHGRTVLLVDDILDSGRTLAFARSLFLERGAAEVLSCVLLDKTVPRAVELEADFSAFPVDDRFVVGYGLDYNNRYRELPWIAELVF